MSIGIKSCGFWVDNIFYQWVHLVTWKAWATAFWEKEKTKGIRSVKQDKRHMKI